MLFLTIPPATNFLFLHFNDKIVEVFDLTFLIIIDFYFFENE